MSVMPSNIDPKCWRDRAADLRVLCAESDNVEIKALLRKQAAECEARADQLSAARDDFPKRVTPRLATLRQSGNRS